jgi:hypothetical protein
MDIYKQQKEILDYIKACVENMNDPKDNCTRYAYISAFEKTLNVFFDDDEIISSLVKLEKDILPNGYVDCPGLLSFSSVPINERLSRIEKKIGVVQSPGDDLGRLENCETHLKITYWRLRKLDEEIYPTQKDVDGTKATVTLDGWMDKLEKKLGVNLAFTDMNHRLKHIEDAWNCTKFALDSDKGIQPRYQLGKYWVYQDKSDSPLLMEYKGKVTISKPEVYAPYVCPPLKHQQDLQNSLQDVFGEYVPKYKVGDEIEYKCKGERVTRSIIGVGRYKKPYYQLNDYKIYNCCDIDNGDVVYKETPPVAWEG